MPKTHLNPPMLFPSQQYRFSQIVTSRGSTLVYLSGQTGWDAGPQLRVCADHAVREALRDFFSPKRLPASPDFVMEVETMVVIK